MKKLMFTAVVAILGIATNAASCSWMTDGVAALAEGAVVSAYAFDTKTMTQDAFLTSWKNGGNWLDYATAGLYDSGAAFGEVSGYQNNDPVNLWTAYFDDTGKNVLLADTISDAIGGQGQDPQICFDMATASTKGFFDATQAGAFAANGAGWYTTPEPTSGLLLLLGLGVMALRRKRA